MSAARFNCDFWCCFLFLLPLRIFLFSSIVCRMLKLTKIFEYTLDVFENTTDDTDLRANCKYWRLIFLHRWFSLYGSVAYIRNMVTLATVQSSSAQFIFLKDSFMQRGFCRCKMCLNIRMDKCNNLLCTLCIFVMVFTRLKLRWVHLQC
jgi:hypothetical protein